MLDVLRQRTHLWLTSSAGFVTKLKGWLRWGLSFLAGLIGVLGLAPIYFWPALLISVPLFLWLLDGCSTSARPLRAAAATGWWFGFGFHLGGLYWIAMAFLVDAAQHAWLIPFAMTAMPGGLALFTLVGALVYVRFSGPSRGLVRLIDFAVVFMLMEWLRGHILTGFPWNLLGYVWGGFLPMAQTASLIGIYGLSLLTLLLALMPAALIAKERGGRIYGAAALILLGGLGGLGAIGMSRDMRETVQDTRLRLVQPSVPQSEKWKPENRNEIFATYLQLSSSAAAEGERPTHVIWPESAVPMWLEDEIYARSAIGEAIGPDAMLLTGAIRKERKGAGAFSYFNSLLTLDGGGDVTGSYDKYHLVPFGEYVPFHSLLTRLGISQLTGSVGGGYSAGDGPKTLDAQGAGIALPMVCYEVIFPGRLASVRGQKRPDWILNVTNDAWYGNSSGPRQHLAMAQFRAIEEGLPLVRSANTGISAVIDTKGRITGRLGLGEKGVLDAELPQKRGPTVYSVVGDAVFWALMILFVVFSAWTRRSSSAAK